MLAPAISSAWQLEACFLPATPELGPSRHRQVALRANQGGQSDVMPPGFIAAPLRSRLGKLVHQATGKAFNMPLHCCPSQAPVQGEGGFQQAVAWGRLLQEATAAFGWMDASVFFAPSEGPWAAPDAACPDWTRATTHCPQPRVGCRLRAAARDAAAPRALPLGAWHRLPGHLYTLCVV